MKFYFKKRKSFRNALSLEDLAMKKRFNDIAFEAIGVLTLFFIMIYGMSIVLN